MKLSRYIVAVPLAITAILLFATDAPRNVGGFAEGESVVENFRIPLEKYPNGRVKVLLVSKFANIPAGGAIRATGVTVELYGETGTFDGLLRAEGLTVNPDTHEAHDSRSVSLEYKGVAITGDGYRWDNEKQSIRIESNVVMRVAFGEGSLLAP